MHAVLFSAMSTVYKQYVTTFQFYGIVFQCLVEYIVPGMFC